MKLNARPVWMAVIACTLGVSLAGCADLPGRISDQIARTGSNLTRVGNGNTAGGIANGQPTALTDLSAASRALVEDSVAALQANTDMEVGALLGEDSAIATGYQVMALGDQAGNLRQKIRIAEAMKQLIRQDEQKLLQRAKKQLDARKGATRVSERTVVTNEDGTRKISAKVDLTTRAGTQKQTLEKLVDEDGTILDLVHDFERTGKNGATVKSHRERHTAEDGSWTGSFTLEIVRKDAKTKTVNWARTGAADGSETGEGKIVRFDGSTVTITFTKTADGTTTTKTVDEAAKVEAEVTKDDVGTTAEATITDTQTGLVVDKVEVGDTETVEVSDK